MEDKINKAVTIDRIKKACLGLVDEVITNFLVKVIETTPDAEPEWKVCNTSGEFPPEGGLVWCSVNGEVWQMKLFASNWYLDDGTWMFDKEEVDAWKPISVPSPYTA